MPILRGHRVLRLSGFAPAVPTPFDEDGALDIPAFKQFCDRQIQHGATALVVCGTTGEAPTLGRDEQHRLVRTAVDVAHGRVPVIAGAGSNSTSHAIELAKDAEDARADAILSITPYYNKPIQAGIFAHFSAIAASTDLPIIMYDVPSRTACGLADSTIEQLAKNQQFIGLKDATGDVTRPLGLRALLGPEFHLLSGDDSTVLGFLAQGGDGCISVTSNLAPGLCRSIYLALKRSQIAQAQNPAVDFMKLTCALFSETNPTPLKYALSLLKLMSSRVRLPLVEPSNSAKSDIASALAAVCERYPDYVIGNRIEPSLHQSARRQSEHCPTSGKRKPNLVEHHRLAVAGGATTRSS
jgi:4-hydroxy-tetrahydrodipicolinate synthase